MAYFKPNFKGQSIQSCRKWVSSSKKKLYTKVLKNITSTGLGRSTPRKAHYFENLKTLVYCKINVSPRV